jgi:hypothetical protein
MLVIAGPELWRLYPQPCGISIAEALDRFTRYPLSLPWLLYSTQTGDQDAVRRPEARVG